jgi:hypothetical protein
LILIIYTPLHHKANTNEKRQVRIPAFQPGLLFNKGLKPLVGSLERGDKPLVGGEDDRGDKVFV